jgi:hypothetical protein
VLRIVDVEFLERYDKRRAYAGDIPKPSEVGRSVLEVEVLSYV